MWLSWIFRIVFATAALSGPAAAALSVTSSHRLAAPAFSVPTAAAVSVTAAAGVGMLRRMRRWNKLVVASV